MTPAPSEARQDPYLKTHIETLFRITQRGMDFAAPEFLLERHFARQWTDEQLNDLNARETREAQARAETLVRLNAEIASHAQDISNARRQMGLLDRAMDYLLPAVPPVRLPEGPRRSAALSRVAMEAAAGKVQQIGYSVRSAQEQSGQRRAAVLADHSPARTAWVAERMQAWKLLRTSLRDPLGREALTLMLTLKRPSKLRLARREEEPQEVRHKREEQQKRLDELLQFELPCALFAAVMTLSMLAVESDHELEQAVDAESTLALANAEYAHTSAPAGVASDEPEEEWPAYNGLAVGY
ncbi:hypothetical protein [Geopseudomonas aromaticivorans]